MERREQVSKGEGVLGRVKRGVYQIFDRTIWPQFQVEGSLYLVFRTLDSSLPL